jgi:hypothetical protein
MGWQRRALTTATTSSWSSALIPHHTAELSGQITAISGSSLDLSGALTGQGNFPAASFANHFVEILDGPNAGHRLLIATAGSSGTLAAIDLSSSLSTLSSLPASLVGARFTLRPARTLSSAFPPNSLTASNGPTTSDRVMIYTNGTQSYTNYWLFSGGGNPYWVREGDGTLTNRNNLVLDPAMGALVQRRGASFTLPSTGYVRANPFAFRLNTKQTLIGTPWPISQSPVSRNMVTANSLTGSNQPSTADTLSIWASDLTPGTPGFTSFFLFQSGLVERWVRQGDGLLQDRSSNLLFLPARAAFWKSINGLSAFVLPSPWTP